MSEQQITSQDERKQKKLIKHQKFSKIFFIVFLIFFCFTLSSLFIPTLIVPSDIPMYGLFLYIFFFLYVVVYLIIFTLFVYLEYKKILWFNIVAIFIVAVFDVLNTTGFCFEKGRYLTNREIIDSAFVDIVKSCEKWSSNKTECKTYEEIQQMYPQCFGSNISNKCSVAMYNYYDSNDNRTYEKINFVVYEIKSGYNITILPIIYMSYLWFPTHEVYSYLKYVEDEEWGSMEYWYVYVSPCGKTNNKY